MKGRLLVGPELQWAVGPTIIIIIIFIFIIINIIIVIIIIVVIIIIIIIIILDRKHMDFSDLRKLFSIP